MHATPWLAQPPISDDYCDFLVLGGGIAGASIANALAVRGYQVTVVDKSWPTDGASNNPAAVIRPVLAQAPNDPLASFYSAAFDSSRRKISELVANGHKISHEFNGVLHCHSAAQRLKGEAAHHYLDLSSARQAIGARVQSDGVFLEHAGWVSPIDYCTALLSHELISKRTNECASLFHDGLRWQLGLKNTNQSISATHVVLANGSQLAQLNVTAPLPIKPMVSQLIHFVDTYKNEGPQVPIVGSATLCPTAQGWMATAGHWPWIEPVEAESSRNAQLLEKCAKQWEMPEQTANATLRAAARATSRDHLPLVGGVPDIEAAMEVYADLRHGRPAHHYPLVPYLPDLFLLGALGGRGITSAQLCTEVLVAIIFGENHRWKSTLHPLRFLVRDLKRGKF